VVTAYRPDPVVDPEYTVGFNDDTRAFLSIPVREGPILPRNLARRGGLAPPRPGDNGPVDDPAAPRLQAGWLQYGRAGSAEAVFGESGLLGSRWRPDPSDLDTITEALV
jgi:hypothetical protein